MPLRGGLDPFGSSVSDPPAHGAEGRARRVTRRALRCRSPCAPNPPPLLGDDSTTGNVQHHSGHPRRSVTGEVQHGLGYVERSPEPPDRVLADQL